MIRLPQSSSQCLSIWGRSTEAEKTAKKNPENAVTVLIYCPMFCSIVFGLEISFYLTYLHVYVCLLYMMMINFCYKRLLRSSYSFLVSQNLNITFFQ